ncbi:hypothetical protein J120_04025 [candidate division TM6 bacterium JCVI TM6SC1]|uniref:ADP,ATP carrier protein n=1 Tax=candidate division TM6 bacterium JCVI TM6SC1 TaxID=1306947 RepID=A0A0D2I1H5_9BACT|nr:hypothetical protein J120_04025 [candidate division TM6 bacterium JCVI TM6SC1]
MIASVVRFFYPELKQEEVRKFGLLALAFFFTIGAYWMLRLLKDAIFFKVAFPASLGWLPDQGALFQPLAKTYSFVTVLVLVALYTKLVDLFEKQKLFYIICSFYAALFAGITAILIWRDVAGVEAVGRTLLAATGWVSYLAIESFGSIVVALFWSFTSSVTDTEAAKRGYPFIIAGAQVGSIAGSALNIFAEHLGGVSRLFFVATVLVLMIMVVVWYFMKTIPAEQLVGNRQAAQTEKKKEGFVEGFLAGIKLLFTRGYLFGILIVATFYEVINTIVDYQMKRQASVFPQYATENGFAKFLGIFGVATNSLALFMALLGTSYIMRKYGLTFCLLSYPIVLGLALGSLYLLYAYGNPSAAVMLWSTFGVMMLAKGLSYAVNNPTKEMMYIPTSKDAKFKTKGWIDMFGSRTAKMGGAQFVEPFKKNLPDLMTYGTLLSLGLIGVWFAAALYVGRKNAELTRKGEIVG